MDNASGEVNEKQLIPKVPKEPNESVIITILEAKFLKLAERNILVITTYKGIFVRIQLILLHKFCKVLSNKIFLVLRKRQRTPNLFL